MTTDALRNTPAKVAEAKKTRFRVMRAWSFHGKSDKSENTFKNVSTGCFLVVTTGCVLIVALCCKNVSSGCLLVVLCCKNVWTGCTLVVLCCKNVSSGCALVDLSCKNVSEGCVKIESCQRRHHLIQNWQWKNGVCSIDGLYLLIQCSDCWHRALSWHLLQMIVSVLLTRPRI